METTHPSSPSFPTAPSPFRRNLAAALRFWERGRIGYNAVLTLVAVVWVLRTWPHFRPAVQLASLAPLTVLALLANVCYCAAYGIDLPLQRSSVAAFWQRWRWSLWLAGTLFAVLLECYWIADEIYPDFP